MGGDVSHDLSKIKKKGIDVLSIEGDDEINYKSNIEMEKKVKVSG